MSREKVKGHISVAKIGKQSPEKVPVCVWTAAEHQPERGWGGKNHMGESVMPEHPCSLRAGGFRGGRDPPKPGQGA